MPSAEVFLAEFARRSSPQTLDRLLAASHCASDRGAASGRARNAEGAGKAPALRHNEHYVPPERFLEELSIVT